MHGDYTRLLTTRNPSVWCKHAVMIQGGAERIGIMRGRLQLTRGKLALRLITGGAQQRGAVVGDGGACPAAVRFMMGEGSAGC